MELNISSGCFSLLAFSRFDLTAGSRLKRKKAVKIKRSKTDVSFS